MFTRVRRAYCGALAMAVVALLSACSGSATGSGNSGNSGTISITVGALPVIDDVAAYIAQDEGFFKKAGLNVKITSVASSGVAIPQLQKGTMDIVGGGNYVSFIQASDGDPASPAWKIIAEAATCAPSAFEVLALPSSGIDTPAKLTGKTIAVNLTNNIQTLMINDDLEADNVAFKTVNYKVVSFPKMISALQDHQVDAIAAVEPFATEAQSAGAQVVFDMCSGPTATLPLSGYIATSAWADKNPQAVQRFQQAISEAQQVADTNRQEVQKALLSYVTGLTPQEAGTLTLDDFPTSADAVQLNRVSDLMEEAGLEKKPLQASALIDG